MTKIDIILPYYNGSLYIAEQLDSIVKSNLEEISVRIILINDASSMEETRYLKSILPSNVLYVENLENLGVIKTVEKGLSLSNADYIMLCDQDDVWLPHKIQISLERIKKIEGGIPSLVYTDLAIVDSSLNILHPSMHKFHQHKHSKIKPSLIFHNIVTGCSVIMNRKILELALPFPPNITMHDHWLALIATFAGRINLLNEITILYRQHNRNQIGASTTGYLKKLLDFKRAIPKFYKHLEMKKEMAKTIELRMNEKGLRKNLNLLKKINWAISERKVLFLIFSGVIHGSPMRIFSFASLFLIKENLFKRFEDN